MNKFLLIHSICILSTIIALRGSKQDSAPIAIFFSFFPIFGQVIGLVAFIDIINRSFKSKGKCIFGHDMLRVYDSETIKHNMRKSGIPVRCSIAGYERYTCTKCLDEETVKWSAF